MDTSGALRAGQSDRWAAWVVRVADGDEAALVELYDDSSALIYGIVLRVVRNAEDAEETTADVYAQIWRTAGNFDAVKSSAAGWMAMVARSRAIDRYRSKLNRLDRTMRDFAPIPDLEDESPQPEFQSILQQRRKMILEALDHLRPDQREALEMAFFLGYTHAELAREHGVSLGTVKSRIRTGLFRLKERLAGAMDASSTAPDGGVDRYL